MFENYLGDYINVTQVARMANDSGMTPKGVIRLAAENKLKAYVEGNFLLNGKPTGPYQKAHIQVLFDVLAKFDEKVAKKTPENGVLGLELDFPPSFGVEIIDAEGVIELCTDGVTGFHPHEFLLNVNVIRRVIDSGKYPVFKSNEGRFEREVRVLAACLAKVLNAVQNGTVTHIFPNKEFVPSRLSKLIDENANAHPELTSGTGDRAPGASESTIRRALEPVAETLKALQQKGAKSK